MAAMTKESRAAPGTIFPEPSTSIVGIYFSDFFYVDRSVLEEYGAFNVSLVNDLPLFIDPFLLFDSEDDEYQALHEGIICYLRFLRDEAGSGGLQKTHIDQWFRFPEVKQNWLGFSKTGNRGSGLGAEFANNLHRNLHHAFRDFGAESVTRSSHLEKLCLLSDGVGRDHLSDFVTNLIKSFLLDYTQKFALANVDSSLRRKVAVSKVKFDYAAKRWTGATYELPYVKGDFVLLTPKAILTRDEAWINRGDMLDDLVDIYESVPDAQLRTQVNDYFVTKLGDETSEKSRREAAAATVDKFPALLDYFIRAKEDTADEAHKVSTNKVSETQLQFIDQVKEFVDEHLQGTMFYSPVNTYAESLARIMFLKDVIENKDGYRAFYLKGKPIKREEHLQIMYRLTWFATLLDVNREVNNGRGPVDYKISLGSTAKTLVEFKLASNTQLRRNLENQVKVYEIANNTQSSITVIMFFNDTELAKIQKILRDLEMTTMKNIVVIDASSDNKPSASLA